MQFFEVALFQTLPCQSLPDVRDFIHILIHQEALSIFVKDKDELPRMYDINPIHDFFFGGRGIVINKQFTDTNQKLLHTLFKMEKSLIYVHI